MSQKTPEEIMQKDTKLAKGVYKASLNYTSLTSDTEESVTGIIEGLEDGEYYVKIQSDSGMWSGSKIKLNKGKFYCTVKVQKNKQNLYWIYVFDSKSNPVKIMPDSLTITHGISVSGVPLPHSIKVVVARQAKNACDPIFDKGDTLPLKKTIDEYKTARKLKKGEENSLNIRVVEGESDKEDRNTFLCEIGIPGKKLPHDLPERTPVQLTVEINESRELNVSAYIPLIDAHFDRGVRLTVYDEKIEVEDINTKLEVQKARAGNVFEYCSDNERKKISESIQSISESVNNSEKDEDEKRKANTQLKNLMILLDEVEEEEKMPQMVKEYNAKTTEIQKLINEYADPKQKDDFNKQLNVVKTDGDLAIKDNNKELLSRANEQLQNLSLKVAYSNSNTWILYFNQMVREDHFTDEKEAQYYINRGAQAISSKDYEELKRCITQLNTMRPVGQHKEPDLSGITS